MPLYKWIASDIENNIQSGTTSASSEEDLKLKLAKKNLNLLDSSLNIPSGYSRISFSAKSQFFHNLYMLIESGVLLPQALELLIPNIDNKNFKNIISDISAEVSQGKQFSECLKNYSSIFSQFMIQMVKSGQESGSLAKCLKQLSEYLELKDNFYKKIRASLTLPIVTFVFFIAISLIIFIYIIPSFSTIDLMSKNELPGITKKIINFSVLLKSIGILRIVISLSIFLMSVVLFFKSKAGAKFKDFLLFNLPLFKKISYNVVLTIFLQAASIMLHAGISLDETLKNIIDSLDGNFLKKDFVNLSKDVQKGASLAESMNKYKIFPQELIAMIYVAQESGNLPQATNLASNLYNQKVMKQLNLVVSLIQPILIIFMGILIAILIASVYLPIVQMPMNIEFV